MSRRRYISTDISIDHQLNKASDFAALLYTWMIPHIADDCRIAAKCADQLRLLVVPGRSHTTADVEAALAELLELSLMGQDEDGIFFVPSESFYKYQTYIIDKRRCKTPQISAKQRRSARNSADQRATPQNSASVSLNLNLKEEPADPAGISRKKESEHRSAQSNSTAHQTPIDEGLIKLATRMGGRDLAAQHKLCQWVISMVRCLPNEPPERVNAVVTASLDALDKRIKAGAKINDLWGYLTTIFDRERTKYIQGPENDGHKRGPIPASVREIMAGIGSA